MINKAATFGENLEGNAAQQRTLETGRGFEAAALEAIDRAEVVGQTRGAVDDALKNTIHLVQADALPGIEMLRRARQAGVPKLELVRMLGRFLVNSTVGNIPVVGDFIDFFWKPNQANVKAFEQILKRRIGPSFKPVAA